MLFLQVRCSVASIEGREQPSIRFLRSPFRALLTLAAGIVAMFAGTAFMSFATSLTPGTYSYNYLHDRGFAVVGIGVFAIVYGIIDLLRWPSSLSLTPEGILWGQSFGAPIFVPWDRIEQVDCMRDFAEVDGKESGKLQLALRTREHLNPKQPDRLAQHQVLFQHYRGLGGYDLLMPANVLMSKPGSVLRIIQRYIDDARRRPFIGSPDELVEIEAYFQRQTID